LVFRPRKAFFRFLEITKKHGLETGGGSPLFQIGWVKTPFQI
jgi:hypothetical protein